MKADFGVNRKIFYAAKKSKFSSPGGMQDNTTLTTKALERRLGIRQARMAELGFSAERRGGPAESL